jgi:transcriptional regulator with XRE-family HTH domain
VARISPTSTTPEILAEIGRRIQRYRLQQNRTLEDIAAEAGVSTLTTQRAESGKNPTLTTLIRILRALGRLDALDAFLPVPLVSPMEIAERGGHEPQRARTPRRRMRTEGDADA